MKILILASCLVVMALGNERNERLSQVLGSPSSIRLAERRVPQSWVLSDVQRQFDLSHTNAIERIEFDAIWDKSSSFFKVPIPVTEAHNIASIAIFIRTDDAKEGMKLLSPESDHLILKSQEEYVLYTTDFGSEAEQEMKLRLEIVYRHKIKPSPRYIDITDQQRLSLSTTLFGAAAYPQTCKSSLILLSPSGDTFEKYTEEQEHSVTANMLIYKLKNR